MRYYYRISFLDKTKNIASEAFKLGYLTNEDMDDYFGHFLNIQKIKEEIETDTLTFYENESIHLNVSSPYADESEAISYAVPAHMERDDDRVMIALSKIFPDEILMIAKYCYVSPSNDYQRFYYKNGIPVTKEGQPILQALHFISPRLCKVQGGNYKISLPIGNDQEKWGSFSLPKENVLYVLSDDRYYLFFDKEEIEVSFKSGNRTINVLDMIDAYNQSRTTYNSHMEEMLSIEGLSRIAFHKMGTQGNSYYIVKIPCSHKISANGILSITVPEDMVNLDTGSVQLGPRKLKRTGLTLNNLMLRQNNYCTNGFIKDAYEEYLKETTQEIQVEEEPEEER